MRSVPSAKRAKYARAPGMASHIVIPDSDSDTTEDPQMVKAEAALKKLKEKEQKRRQKEFDKAFQKAARETRRECRGPSERLRQMVLILDSTLVQNRDFMEALVEELDEAGVEHRVGQDGPVGSVRWRRKQHERSVTDDAQITETVTENEENNLLLTLEAQGFAGLVHCSKMADQGTALPVGSQTLQEYIERVRRDHDDMTVSLAVEGMDTYFRGNKTKTNRQFRKRVLGDATGDHATPGPVEVTWLDCQEAIVSLQLLAGCTVRLCQGSEQLAEYVITLTKAVAEKPFRNEGHFSFHPDAAAGHKKRVESGNQLSTTWKNQLMQFNNLSEPMAAAVVAEYPTPAHLISAYASCDEHRAPLLLQNITVRRGVGTVASTRRLGPVQSRRIHSLLTTADPHMIIT